MVSSALPPNRPRREGSHEFDVGRDERRRFAGTSPHSVGDTCTTFPHWGGDMPLAGGEVEDEALGRLEGAVGDGVHEGLDDHRIELGTGEGPDLFERECRG